MNEEIYLQLEDVSKEYQRIKAVSELSLTVFKGDIYGFLGPNGAGKSTSIRMILSLINPDSGKIKLFGKDLSLDRYRTLSRVGALIEKPDFYSYLSARKNLEILGKISNVKNLNQRIDEVLDLVKLTDRQNSKVRTFSQGMKQRLGIAQSILHEPDLIILDEPGNGLDPQGQQEMRQLILRLNKEFGITILISSHILSEVERIANRMVIINKGKKVVEGKVVDLLNGNGSVVIIEVSDIIKAAQIIRNEDAIQVMKTFDDHKLQLSISRNNIPRLLKTLEQNSIDVFSVVPASTLEDYFIDQTEHA